MAPAELRLAFKLRALELRAAHAPVGDLRVLEHAFNTLAHPELRACYDALLNDSASPAVFPYGGFGSLLACRRPLKRREGFLRVSYPILSPRTNLQTAPSGGAKDRVLWGPRNLPGFTASDRSSLRPSIVAAVVGHELEPVETFDRRQGRSQRSLHSER